MYAMNAKSLCIQCACVCVEKKRESLDRPSDSFVQYFKKRESLDRPFDSFVQYLCSSTCCAS